MTTASLLDDKLGVIIYIPLSRELIIFAQSKITANVFTNYDYGINIINQ